ncbi:cell division protein [Buttiauxella ferragutiae ATCC 51602]|uniref:Cell division protein n=1 Tax=Buttiauxella ferragutiae ATCC 51602 TaxID=1354252 RepID=A0ABX2W8Q8_9ENTR|nr:cell division protein [Buttiauxella ferragutiae ATCC 51602]
MTYNDHYLHRRSCKDGKKNGAPFIEPMKVVSARPGMALVALVVVMALLWIVL